MFNIKTVIFTQAFILTALSISGCNNDSSSNTPAEPTAESKITASNAKPITAAALTSVDTAKGLPIRSGTLSNRSGNDASGEFNYSDFIINQLSTIQQQSQLMGRGIPGVLAATVNKPLDCNLHVTGDIADISRLSVGDTASFTFNACTYNSVLSINGMIGITLTHISDNFTGTPPYELGIDTLFTNFTVNDDGSIYTCNGDMSMLIAKSEPGHKAADLSGNTLSVSFGLASQNNTLTLTDYVIDSDESISGDYSVSKHGTVELTIPFIRIKVSFSTITSFTGNHDIGTGDPTAGELHIIGALGSQAWVIAQPDGVNIQIDIDVDGDDVVDETVMTTWAELQDLF
jgi:hypothetical protein